MALQVCISNYTQQLQIEHLCLFNAAMANVDYVPVTGDIIQFSRGDVTQTYTITINDDDECEDEPNESFFSNIALDGGIDINITIDQAVITINDTAEPECGKCIIASNTNSEIALNHSGTIEVGYEYTTYTTSEGQENVLLCVVVTNFPDGAPRPFTLLATTEDGSAGTVQHDNTHAGWLGANHFPRTPAGYAHTGYAGYRFPRTPAGYAHAGYGFPRTPAGYTHTGYAGYVPNAHDGHLEDFPSAHDGHLGGSGFPPTYDEGIVNIYNIHVSFIYYLYCHAEKYPSFADYFIISIPLSS